MQESRSPKVTVIVSHAIPLHLLKKYASQKPLRRPAPRSKQS
jgi:hypothetical protein